MGYLYDHTVFFDANPLYLIPVVFMFATLIFCFFKVRKMKRELKTLEKDLSDRLAKTAVEDSEPMMRNTIDESK